MKNHTEGEAVDVETIFRMLLEKIGTELAAIEVLLDEEKIERARRQSIQVRAFRDRVSQLQQEWEEHLAPQLNRENQGEKSAPSQSTQGGHPEPDETTPQRAYYQPILEVLAAHGGKASTKDVLKHVFQRMSHRLKEVDLEHLFSQPETPRWKNAVQWALRTMSADGLVQKNSHCGMWEISGKGYDFLQNTRNGGN